MAGAPGTSHPVGAPTPEETRSGRCRRLHVLAVALTVVVALLASLVTATPAAAEAPFDPCDQIITSGPDGRLLNVQNRVVQLADSPDQRAAVCRWERTVLAEMAAERGLPYTLEEQLRLLSWGRNDVRAALFVDLLRIVATDEAERTDDEQVVLAWFRERVRLMRLAQSQAARAEYDLWDSNPCNYTPPDPYIYDGNCEMGLMTLLFGPPDPPSLNEFLAYGTMRALTNLLEGHHPQIARQTAAVLEAAIIISSGVALTVGIGAAAVAAAGSFKALMLLIFPFAAAGKFVAAHLTAASSALGPIAIITVLIIVATIRAIQVAEITAIPFHLDAHLSEAAKDPDLEKLVTNDNDLAIAFAAFLDATLPDHPNPAFRPPAPTDPDETTPGFMVTGDSGPRFETALTLRLPGGPFVRAWIDQGWWVVDRGPGLPKLLTRTLNYRDHDNVHRSATIVDGEFLVLDHRSPLPKQDCPADLCQRTTTLRIQSRVPGTNEPVMATATLADHSVELVSGPTVQGLLEDGETVTLSALATTGPGGGQISYRWRVARESAHQPGVFVETFHDGQVATHTFLGGGSYRIEVTATDELGVSRSADVEVEVAPRQLSLQVEQQVISLLGTVLVRPWHEGAQQWFSHFEGISAQGARLRVEVDTLLDARVRVDWNLDGTWTDWVDAPASEPAFFTPPVYQQPGIHPARIQAVADDGAEFDGVLGMEVRNLPPDVPEVEIWTGTEWRNLTDPADAVEFQKGDTVTARLRVSDPGAANVLTTRVSWADGTRMVLPDLEHGVWHEVSHTFSTGTPPPLGLLVRALDDFGGNSFFGGAHFQVLNIPVEVSNLDASVDLDGVVTLSGNYHAALDDAQLVRIDWGDGTVDEHPLPMVIQLDDVDGFLLLDVGLDEFVVSHRYEDLGDYPVTVHVLDLHDVNISEDATLHELLVQVTNRRPSIDDLTQLDLQPEGVVSTLAFRASDPEDEASSLTVEVDWGDGTVTPALYDEATDEFVVTHAYADNGTYEVTVVAIDPHDAPSDELTATVEIDNAAPALDTLMVDEEGDEGSPINIGGTASDAPADLAAGLDIVIDFGDGTDTTITAELDGSFATTHTYADDGTYTVTVHVVDKDGGESDPATRQVEIHNVAPALDTLMVDEEGDEGSPIAITGTASDAPADLAAGLDIVIDFGDGTDTTITAELDGSFATTHTYADDGTYTVTVHVVDKDGGESDPATRQVEIHNVAPALDALAVDEEGDEGSPVDISGTASDAPADLAAGLHIVIDFGDGTNDTVTAEPDGTFATTHTYADNGTYTVTVHVADKDGGQSAPDTHQVQIHNVAPTIVGLTLRDGAGGELGGGIGTVVGLPIEVLVDFVDPGVLDTHTFEFDWGDDTYDTTAEQAASHVYSAPGEFYLTVTVTDKDGDWDQRTVIVHVLAPGEVVDWAIQTIEEINGSVSRSVRRALDKALRELDGPGRGSALDALDRDDLGTAATKLRNAVNELVSASDQGAEVDRVVDLLVLLLKSIALDVIAEAEATDPDSRALARAYDDLARGDAALAEGDMVGAAAAYRNAINRILG